MRWHFCIDTHEQRAFDFCGGSMNEGNGYGCGYGFSHGDGRGGGDNKCIQPRDGGRSVAGVITDYSPRAWV